jgi:Ca-activated chloride channel family protein
MTTLLPTFDDESARTPLAASDDAGFGSLTTTRGCLPLKAMDVRGRIDGLLAQVTLAQTFVNTTDEPLEATYIFPLPDRAGVTHFRMEVADRIIDGLLEECEQARQHYDRAIQEGRRASIAEEERPGVFTLRVGNLQPGEEATVHLTMAGVLPYHQGEVTFRFPLVVAPRYIPGIPLSGPSVGDGTAVDTDSVPDASRITPPVLLPGFPNPVRLTLQVDLHGDMAAVDQVRTSLHATWSEASGGNHRVTLCPGSRLDRDFILRFRLEGESVRSALTLHPDSEADPSGEGTFALTIIPPAEVPGAVVRPRDVVFVLDRSGSMQGWKMVAARRAVARMVDTLGANDRFAVYAFDQSIETPENNDPHLVSATNRERFRAIEFLAKIEARGGTEIAQPLELAVRRLGGSAPARDRVLVLITDGQLGNEDQVLATVGPIWGGIRGFTLGIDRAVNAGFLRRLAELGGGACELVESEERLDEVMTSMHRRIGTPVLTGVSMDVEGALGIQSSTLVPRRMPDLFAGAPLLMLGRYRGRPRGAVVLRAVDARGGNWREELAPSLRANPAIAAAWARGQVRALEDQFAIGVGDRAALEREIVATSLRFHVLCRFTAFVAVDRSEAVNEGRRVHRITQPVEMPSGWETLGVQALFLVDDRDQPHVSDFGLATRVEALSELAKIWTTIGASGRARRIQAERELVELEATDPKWEPVDNRLAAVLKGDPIKDNAERLQLAYQAHARKLYGASARMFEEALQADPKLADDRRAQHRYHAACCATLAAVGASKDKPAADEIAGRKLREQAMNLLNAELDAWAKLLESADPEQLQTIVQTLEHWRADIDLASVRDEQELAKLPECERKEWNILWARVKTLLAKAEGK